jgi:hypothetical protein
MIDSNHLLFVNEGTLPQSGTRIIARTPPYDHCNFTIGPDVSRGLAEVDPIGWTETGVT